jgi:uncharacterized membrane protein
MKNKILWGISLLPSAITLIAIYFMDDKVPMHYDLNGNIDRWGSKYENLIFPVIIILTTLLWTLFIRYFKKKQLKSNDEKTVNEAQLNEKVLYYVAYGTSILFTIMQLCFLYSAFKEAKNNMNNMAVDLNAVINILLGIFFILLGNIMPKCKLNSVVGVRTTWSMKNDKTWAESNRFGGISFMISGALVIAESLLISGIASTFVMLGIVVADGIISTIYSYKVYKKYGSI